MKEIKTITIFGKEQQRLLQRQQKRARQRAICNYVCLTLLIIAITTATIVL